MSAVDLCSFVEAEHDPHISLFTSFIVLYSTFTLHAVEEIQAFKIRQREVEPEAGQHFHS